MAKPSRARPCSQRLWTAPWVDGANLAAQGHAARRLDGRCHARKGVVEESPGSTGMRCRLTAGGGDPRESATENKPPTEVGRRSGSWVRVKRCGKSAPPRRQRRGQGKPHREQDRIGAAGEMACASMAWTRGHSRPVARVGRVRHAARRVPEEWPSKTARAVRTEPGLQTVWRFQGRILAIYRF